MKVKLKDSGNKIHYGSSCMGFGPDIRIALNNGDIVDIESIPAKGDSYVEKVSSGKNSGGKS